MMGKNNEKTGLGRALVRHHNQMIQLSKDKGRAYRLQQKKVLESVTDVNDIDAVVDGAEEAAQLFSADNPIPNLLIDPGESSSDISDMTPSERREQQKKEEILHASSLRVPRRPPWNAKMSVEELDFNERRAFLEWRRSLASLEENGKLVLTPFEKNLDIWRQLWRVIERSDLLVMVVDARNPLFYRCPDLEEYVREIDEHKQTLLLVNKADLLPLSVREKWVNFFQQHGILFVFWSAKVAFAALEGKNDKLAAKASNSPLRSDNADTKIYNREELLARLQSEAKDIANMSRKSGTVTVGFVGYPNVGKSSTINALVGQKRTGVTSTPGKTKHFQTLIISDELTLCDCPGLVFPSFSSSRYEMVASGVLPIDRMTEHREAVQVVANRVPRDAIESIYNITLPKPKAYEPQTRPPLSSEFLRAYCASRGYVASSGLPDETRAARIVLKDYIDGKLPHFELPPGLSKNEVGFGNMIHESDSYDSKEPSDSGDKNGTSLDHVLHDLSSFDMANGLVMAKAAARKKPENASHKQHKKPQRKKDRSWRIGNDNGDGTPIVRVFHKPVNTGPPKA